MAYAWLPRRDRDASRNGSLKMGLHAIVQNWTRYGQIRIALWPICLTGKALVWRRTTIHHFSFADSFTGCIARFCRDVASPHPLLKVWVDDSALIRYGDGSRNRRHKSVHKNNSLPPRHGGAMTWAWDKLVLVEGIKVCCIKAVLVSRVLSITHLLLPQIPTLFRTTSHNTSYVK